MRCPAPERRLQELGLSTCIWMVANTKRDGQQQESESDVNLEKVFLFFLFFLLRKKRNLKKIRYHLQ